MRRSTLVALLIAGVVGATLLVLALIRAQQNQPQPLTNNVVNNVPLTNKPTVVPDTLSTKDQSDIQALAKLFVETFAGYDASIDAENINLAAGYATANFRQELLNFAPTQEAQRSGKPTESISSVVTSVTVERTTAAGTGAQVVAHVSGTTHTATGGSGVDTKFSGELQFVQVGGLWFVDGMAFTPPLLGFK
ncbi:MAG: hypothetical protein U0514_02950 [Candidatus Andersenbacteria bacterium]